MFDEAVRRVMWEDFDVEGTMAAMRLIESGEISFQISRVTPMGQAGLRNTRELIMPQRADRSILMALKRRLESETLSMTCLSCRTQFRMTPASAPPHIVCPKCGGMMVAALLPYNRDDVGLLKKSNLTQEEGKEVRRMYKNAELVRAHGPKALLALAGRGVGPDTADRILSGFHDDEEDLLRDILSAELTYARTKRFWD